MKGATQYGFHRNGPLEAALWIASIHTHGLYLRNEFSGSIGASGP